MLADLLRDRVSATALLIIIAFIMLAISADIVAPHNPNATSLTTALRPAFPSAQALPDYWLGTDGLGRDLLSRLIHGARSSLAAAFGSVGLSIVVGVPMGMAALRSARLDNLAMRAMEVILAFPELLLAIAVIAALGPGLTNAVIAIAVGNVPRVARVVRGQVLSVKDLEFVLAARAIGAPGFRIALRHVLPNAVPIIIVYSSLLAGRAILAVAGLGFLGLGASPPTAEWGAMLNDARELMMIGAWGPVVFPGAAILLTVLALNLLGDAVRDALDPRLR